MDQYTAIDPFFRDREYDQEESRQTHYNLFGHYPPTDLNEKCEHPIHAKIRREMNDANVVIHFNPEDVISDDSELAKLAKDRYNTVFMETRQFQQQVEEEDEWERLDRLGIIHPGRIY
jgi:hypothetical protein